MSLNTDKIEKTYDKYVTDNRTNRPVCHSLTCSFLLPCGMCEKTNKQCPFIMSETVWLNNTWYGEE